MRAGKIARAVGSGAKLVGALTAILGTATYSSWRAKRAFAEALREMGLPDEAVHQLSQEFPSLRKLASR